MKTPQLPEVNWCELYGKLSEAVDHAGYLVVTGESFINLVRKEHVHTQKLEDSVNTEFVSCPDCKTPLLFECPGCSKMNYPEPEKPTYFTLDMDGSMVPDPEGEWQRRW